MDDKHRSMISTPQDMPDPNLIRNKFWGNITDDERTKFERLYHNMLDKKGAADDISQVEEKLKEIIVHEEYIRTLRQRYEDKLRSFKLSEAVTTSRRL
ncbi:MAG: hypothetical protein ABIJ47_13755 [Candidatus Bathyarchaeota archaeon]